MLHLVGSPSHKNLAEAMQRFFLNKQSLLKALAQNPAQDVVEAPPPVPWHTGLTKGQEEKSEALHQQRVERSHQSQDLHAKKVDPATIGRQVGVSRQSVYTYLQMKQPPERARIHREHKPLIDPYKEYLIRRWNQGCRRAQQM